MLSTHKTARWWGLLGHWELHPGHLCVCTILRVISDGFELHPLRCIGEACAVIKARLGAD